MAGYTVVTIELLFNSRNICLNMTQESLAKNMVKQKEWINLCVILYKKSLVKYLSEPNCSKLIPEFPTSFWFTHQQVLLVKCEVLYKWIAKDEVISAIIIFIFGCLVCYLTIEKLTCLPAFNSNKELVPVTGVPSSSKKKEEGAESGGRREKVLTGRPCHRLMHVWSDVLCETSAGDVTMAMSCSLSIELGALES